MTFVEPIEVITGFARALRAAGIAADHTRLSTGVAALTYLDGTDKRQLYWALRLTLCAEPADLPVFDALFHNWFGTDPPPLPAPGPNRTRPKLQAVRPLAADQAELAEAVEEDEPLRTAASDLDALRHRDVTELTAEERAEVQRMIALLRPRMPTRRGLRRRPGGRERVDVTRTVRQMLRDGGETEKLRYRSRRSRARRLVLLLDISGSMAPYADVLLRYAHAAVRTAPTSTEVFTIGTRLTRVTRQLRLRDAELALEAAGQAIPDWSGGTRLGESLRAFLDLWGQRGTARQAVVVIASDGWERGDAVELGEQSRRLARLAHTVVWVNPHKGKYGFAPITAGMVAALPYVDQLVAGHSFAALRELAEVIADA